MIAAIIRAADKLHEAAEAVVVLHSSWAGGDDGVCSCKYCKLERTAKAYMEAKEIGT